MIKLESMNTDQYEAFMEISMKDHMRSQIKAGEWTESNALDNMKEMKSKVLNNGLDTQDHYFFNIVEGEDTQVGGLWFAKAEGQDQELIFIIDIQIFEEHRRKGYGESTFKAMEDKAKDMGIGIIALHVFDHNEPAKALYAKLGYTGQNGNLAKIF